jgi:hypothetical protein
MRRPTMDDERYHPARLLAATKLLDRVAVASVSYNSLMKQIGFQDSPRFWPLRADPDGREPPVPRFPPVKGVSLYIQEL